MPSVLFQSFHEKIIQFFVFHNRFLCTFEPNRAVIYIK